MNNHAVFKIKMRYFITIFAINAMCLTIIFDYIIRT